MISGSLKDWWKYLSDQTLLWPWIVCSVPNREKPASANRRQWRVRLVTARAKQPLATHRLLTCGQREPYGACQAPTSNMNLAWKAGSPKSFRWRAFRSCCRSRGPSISACLADCRQRNVDVRSSLRNTDIFGHISNFIGDTKSAKKKKPPKRLSVYFLRNLRRRRPRPFSV
jgi:hypothetical protein